MAQTSPESETNTCRIAAATQNYDASAEMHAAPVEMIVVAILPRARTHGGGKSDCPGPFAPG